MAVQRRTSFLSQQRIDTPDMRAIESAVSNDFDQLVQAFITGTSQGYIIRGFNILMSGAIGSASNSLQLEVDPGAVLSIDASQSGTVLMVPVGTAPQTLNAATNSNVTGAFAPNAINYVSLDYVRALDDSTAAQVYLWNPTTNTEDTINAPRAIVLSYIINISTTSPTSTLLPISTIITDAGNNVVSVEDNRWLLYRLGTGGATPNPFFTYPWPDGRVENPVTSSSDGIDPFTGADKNILSLKDWMNAVMSILIEVKGTNFWYSASSGSLIDLRQDLGNTVLTGSGNISHGIIPNSVPILTTTGNTVVGNDQITSLASTVGIADGQYTFAAGVPIGTTVLNITGPVVTMSANATLNGTGIGISFYDPSVITGPGQINWNEPISIRVVGSSLMYNITANPTSSDIVLTDDQVCYVTLVREVSITPNLIFTNGSQIVTSVGAVSWTGSLIAGDFVKLSSDTNSGYYEIQSVDSLSQVTLTTPFAETSTAAGGAQAQYAFGSYSAAATPTTNRNLYISSREAMPPGGDVFWLFLREDNGGDPTVYIRFLGAELSNGEDRDVSGTTPAELLKYIGSPSPAASLPQYVSALVPDSIPEITTLTFGSESATAQSSYFFIYPASQLRSFYVWFNLNGGGTDPAPGAGATPIEVDLTTGQTNSQVASLVATALNSTFYGDFNAVATGSQVLVTNTSAGATTAITNGDMISPFTIAVDQVGTGTGNNYIKDGDSLTLAIKELDEALGQFVAAVNEPAYDQTIDIVASGATPPTSLNGPISATTVITLPNNSRLANVVQKYEVGSGFLEVFLNGVYQRLGIDWAEVGNAGSLSTQFKTLVQYVVGDSVELRLSAAGGGSGSGGGEGPAGPPGPSGPPGHDAAGGPVAISTKNGNYSVLLSDNVLLVDCTSGVTTMTLPAAATSGGHVFYFKKVDSSSNNMVIQANGSELIDSANTLSSNVQFEAFTLITDSTQWWIF
jgi:hypothetical protein